LEARANADLARLEEELVRRPFLLGEEPSIADISCCAYLLVAGEAALDVAPHRSVAAWLDRIRALPGYQAQYDLMA
jgi:glutathione S-transferase